MKRKFIIISSIILSIVSTYSQRSAYYDALYFKSIMDVNGGVFKRTPENKPVFDYYYGPGLSDFQLSTLIQANPFLYPFFDIGGEQSIPIGLSFVRSISSVSDLNVSNFADGMAKFIVKRTKQELSTAFFERFKQDLDNTKQIQILFPATYKTLKAIDQEIYNYSAYLDLLRESFQKDLVLILPDITKLINDSCMNDVFINHPEIKTILSDALYLTNEFSQGKHPGECIHEYTISHANADLLNKIEPNLYPSLQTLDLFSQSLRSKQANQYWISSDSLKLLFEDTTFQIYLGLIYQQATIKPKIAFNGVDFTEKLKEANLKIELYKTYLTNLISKASSAHYYFKAIKDKQIAEKDKPTYQDYYSLLDASLNLFEYVSDTPTLVDLQALNKSDTTKLNSYFTSVRNLGNIYVDIYEKQYTSSIVEFSSTFTNLLLSKVKLEMDSTNEQIVSLGKLIRLEKDVTKITTEKTRKAKLELKKTQLENIQKTASLVLKYGNFAATLAKAENSDDVQNAIEAVALPAGSSRIKRESKSNVSINAYCGLYGGKNMAGGWSTGLTAPIGISASWGIYKHSSFSLFFSIIDLGAPVAFRFSTNSDSIPTIKLADIISPGLFVSLGIPKCPISINAGCQMTPLLTSVSTKGNAFGAKSLRVTLAFCVDLPLLTLYNKSR